MKSKGLLVNYSGYPLYISSFMPESGLATLAGSLISAGYEARIKDFSNLDIIEKLYPRKASFCYQETLDSINQEITYNKVISKELLNEINSIEVKIKEYRQNQLKKFALRLNSEIKRRNIDFIGFKLFIGEGFEGSVRIAEHLRELNPEIKIFAGGPQVDLFGDLVYGITDVFDSLSIGEGDQTIVELAKFCDGMKKIDDIPNLILKKENKIRKTRFKRIKVLNDLKLPEYSTEIYPELKRDSKIKVFYIDESRGCPNSCNFCLHPIKSGKYWRVKSPKRIIKEMKLIIDQFGTNAFRFAGSNTPPFLNKKIAQEIIAQELEIKYTCFGHVGKFNTDYFKLLRRAGCCSLFFGIESGSQYILDESINKNVSVAEIESSLKKAKESGLFVVTSLIIPSPLETEKTKEDTFYLMKKIKPNSCVLTVPIVFTGTEWYNNYNKYCIEIKDKKELSNSLMTYQAKFSFPTQLWNPFKYKINGKSFHELTEESQIFGSKLKKEKIYTDITDEIYLMSLFTDYTPIEFRDKSREYILKGDSAKLRLLIKNINKNLIAN